jgi:hypothetical protein
VYLARHLKLNRLVALKMILAGAHAGAADVVRFLSEAEAVAAFRHPNIVQVYEVGHHKQLPYIALEFVEGGSLKPKQAAVVCLPPAAALVQTIGTTHNPSKIRQLAEGLELLAPYLKPQQATAMRGQAVVTLSQNMTKTTDPAELWELEFGLRIMATHLTPEQAVQAAAILTRPMRETRDPLVLHPLAQGLTTVAKSMKAEAAAAILSQAMSQTKDPNDLSQLADGLAEAVARLDLKAAAILTAPAAVTLKQAMSKTTDPDGLRDLAKGLAVVAAYMKPNEARDLCGPAVATLSQVMNEAKNPSALQSLARGLAALAARLPPNEAHDVCRRTATNLTQAMSKTADRDALTSLAEGLLAVAQRLEPNEAAVLLTQAMNKTMNRSMAHSLWMAELSARLVPKDAAVLCAPTATVIIQAMADTTDPNSLLELRKRLSAVLTEVHPDEQYWSVAVVGAVLAGPTDGFAALGRWVLLPSALKPLPCRLFDQQLVDLLKHPFCVGAARRVILDHLGNRHHRRFADQWDFVRYAQEHHRGLDFTTPPQRPGH